MRFPVVYALSYPGRLKTKFSRLNLIDVKKLSFEEPDYYKFPCLKLAYTAAKKGGTMTTVLNAANEVAVDLFLNKKINFFKIPEIIKKVMNRHLVVFKPTIDNIIKFDKWAREEAYKLC